MGSGGRATIFQRCGKWLKTLVLGHTHAAMTGHYTLIQREPLEKLVRNMQERGSAVGEVVAFRKEKKA